MFCILLKQRPPSVSQLQNVLVENNIQVIFVTEDDLLVEYYVSQYITVQNYCLLYV